MTSSSAEQTDVTILGAGIIGLCSALSLQERGYTVTLVDRDPPGEGASFGNAGVISPWSCVPQCLPGTWQKIPGWLLDPEGPVRARWQNLLSTIPWALQFLANTEVRKVERIADAMDFLMRDNVEAYRRHLAGTGQDHLVQDSLMVNVFRGDAQPNLKDLAWRLRIDHGAPVEVIGSAELRELEPAISSDYHSAIVVSGQARALSPGAICKALAEKARTQGALFRRCAVQEVARDGNGRIELRTDQGQVFAKTLVVSAGAWSTRLLKSLGVRMPLIAERGYHLEFVNPSVALRNSVMDVAGKFIASSMDGGLRAAGTAEFASVDAPPNYKRARILNPLTKRLLPNLESDDVREWMGVRPSFPDNLPAIGELPGHPGIIAAFGHSHYGLGMAPATGRLVADVVAGAARNDSWDAFSVERYVR